MSDAPHVVIVGAGFGGLGVAEELAHAPVVVTLIDRHNYHAFQPLLYPLVTSSRQLEAVNISLTRQTSLVQLGHLVIVRGNEWSSAATKRFRHVWLGAKIPYNL